MNFLIHNLHLVYGWRAQPTCCDTSEPVIKLSCQIPLGGRMAKKTAKGGKKKGGKKR
jgi:hypothetical protein